MIWIRKDRMLLTYLLVFALTSGTNHLSSADDKLLVRTNNEFASRFYQILANSREDNFIFCPLCLSTGMAMLSVGAHGETLTELQQATGFSTNETAFLEAYQKILGQYRHIKSTKSMYTGIFLSGNVRVKSSYQNILGTYFDTSTKVLDSGMNGLEHQLNNITSMETSDELSDLISSYMRRSGDKENSITLANTFRFKAGWEKKFDFLSTTQEPFHVSPSEILSVKMMRQTGHFNIINLPDLESRAISIPYLLCDGFNLFQKMAPHNRTLRSKPRPKKRMCKSGVQDSRLHMVVLLPNDQTGLRNVESKLTPETLNSIPSKFEYKTYLDLSLPSFQLNSKHEFINITSKLGLQTLTNSTIADFSRLSKSQSLHLGSIYHHIAITVEEKGSRTKSSLLKGANPWAHPKLVKIDHPFLAFIHDKKTDAILLVLRVVRPVPPF